MIDFKIHYLFSLAN